MNENTTDTDPHEPADDTRLFGELRHMWEARDPMPPGLIDDVLVALETRSLADDYALLILVEDTTELVGARGPSGVRVLEFAEGETTVMLRVSVLDDDRLRLDGWVVPAIGGSAHLEQDDADLEATISPEGRFEITTAVRGTARLRLIPSDTTGNALTTDPFDI